MHCCKNYQRKGYPITLCTAILCRKQLLAFDIKINYFYNCNYRLNAKPKEKFKKGKVSAENVQLIHLARKM